MRALHLFVLALVLGSISFAQTSRLAAPQTVTLPSGNLRLKASLWKPAGNGPFPAVLFNHGTGTDAQHTAGMTMAEAAEKLAPVFVKHGYAFPVSLSPRSGSLLGSRVVYRRCAQA